MIPAKRAPGKDTQILHRKAGATHAVIGATATGYVVVYLKRETSSLFVLALDATGRPVGRAAALPMPTAPSASYHRGVHPLRLAKRKGGWFVVVEASSGIYLASLDDKLNLAGAPVQISAIAGNIAQPNIAVGGDRAFITWTSRDKGAHLRVVAVDLDGQPISKVTEFGSETEMTSLPVTLDDGGFAMAWFESDGDVHVGRWSAKAEPTGSALVDREALSQTIALQRDGSSLVVAYQTEVKYPFAVYAKKVELSVLH